MNLTHLPLRAATGAFILNSGLGKLRADEPTAEGLHGMAANAYPQLASMKPKDFTRLLAVGEVAIGGALLAPMVPSVVAGGALTGFGAGLVGLYLKTPGMTQPDGIRPTQEGTGLAKDVWLLGAGATLTLSGIFGGARKAGRRARKAGRQARKQLKSTSDDVVGALPFG